MSIVTRAKSAARKAMKSYRISNRVANQQAKILAHLDTPVLPSDLKTAAETAATAQNSLKTALHAFLYPTS